ncbi:hypothetical protein GCM10008983_00540 [Lentibacillus halophilus]|uniref:HD-GYP domain-containing protein n=1 Tax=Lentibacillus halophilus TaxID=295065 RepID=A0ABP3IUX3_9BACI
MQAELRKASTLLDEERRTTIWFLWIFYIIYFSYDIVYYIILPEMPWESAQKVLNNGLGYWTYIILLSLLPIAFYLMHREKTWIIKYMYFITFTIMNIINDIWIYWGVESTYSNGNIIEIVIVLFAPIFVNKTFFNLVSLGTIFKFIVLGIVLRDFVVTLPITLIVVLSIIGYILLHRFIRYVSAVEISYDKQLEGIVKGVIATLELKDHYTRGHSERVAQYAMTLARATGKYQADELKSFYYACLLHDIGKVYIPDSILTKTGKLTDEEFELIKTHPVVGADAVQEVEGIDDNLDVIRHHHERWDGRGYPDGLKGTEISFLTRVITIADVFDAMTSSRSYRTALPVDVAYEEIVSNKGTQFDPDLMETFKHVYPEWVAYHEHYQTHETAFDEAAPDMKGGD